MVDEDFAWRLAQELVRIDSSDPGAYEDEIERFIKRLIELQLAQLDSSALDAVQIEELEVLPGRRNLKVTVPGQSDEPRLIYICHMDTVTLGDGWDADIEPLGAVVRDDKLYGRGACDMKGGLACAIAALVHTLERVAADGALPAHDELGPSTITFGQIEGGYRPYVVPDRAKVWVDMRLTPPTDTAAAINMVEHAIAVAEAAVPGCHGSYTVTGDRPAIERDPNSPLLAALKRAADDVTDADTTVGFFTGYTDTAVIAGKTGNRNCMSYGPGSLALAHKPDEYVPHADIVRCQNVLIALADNTLWDASGQVGA